MAWFLIKRMNGGFTWDGIMNLAPFELELFYNMAIKDLKDEVEEKNKEQEQTNLAVSHFYKAITGRK